MQEPGNRQRPPRKRSSRAKAAVEQERKERKAVDEYLKIVKRDPNRKYDPKTVELTKKGCAFMQKLKDEGKLSEFMAKHTKAAEDDPGWDVYLK